MKDFWTGFEKQAISREALAVGGGMAAYLGGLGALVGHGSHVQKKLMHARQGKEYKPSSFIDKHPKTTGALSLGLAPAISANLHQRKLDRDNPKVREVMNKHPFMTSQM